MMDTTDVVDTIVKIDVKFFSVSRYPDDYFPYFSTETSVVATHWKRLNETLPMSITTDVFIEK